MSEMVVSQSVEPVSEGVGASSPAGLEPVTPVEFTPAAEEFSYRPVPIAAPVSLFLGFCSFLGLYAIVGLGIGVFGMLLGGICYYRIRKSGGELGGKWIAASGALLSLAFLATGSGLLAYNVSTEVLRGSSD